MPKRVAKAKAKPRVSAKKKAAWEALAAEAGAAFTAKDYPKAINLYNELLREQPDNWTLLVNLGCALTESRDAAAAKICFERALKIRPNQAVILANLGCVLRDMGDLAGAKALHEQAIALDGNEPQYQSFLALTLLDLQDVTTAEKLFRRVLASKPNDPGVMLDLAITRLFQGDFAGGWPLYEARWRLPGVQKPALSGVPEWQGESLQNKTIVVFSEQGFGDTIHFCRYLPLLQERGATVILETRPEQTTLFKGQQGVNAVWQRGAVPPKGVDYHISMLTIPLRLWPHYQAIPNHVPYLRAPAPTRVIQRARAKALVGICWAGTPGNKRDHHRSMPLTSLAPLLEVPGVRFVSLQKGERANDIVATGMDGLIIDMSDDLRDFAAAASIIAQLDLVITVDTAPAHLAGALAKPVWVMYPPMIDWRWQINRHDSPWYPSMRLFPQTRHGDWTGVVQQVQQALQKFVAASPARQP